MGRCSTTTPPRVRSPAGHDAIADAERATLAQLDDLTDELARLP